MEKHAEEDSDKANFVIVCINGEDAAKEYVKKHSLKHVTHLVGEAPADYSLSYIPHHVVIDENGKVMMNYDKPTRDYMSLL